MEDCWDILGIEDPTKPDVESEITERDIKRAYAKKLKVTRPDRDPEGFQKLREAFEEAKVRLKHKDLDFIQIDGRMIAIERSDEDDEEEQDEHKDEVEEGSSESEQSTDEVPPSHSKYAPPVSSNSSSEDTSELDESNEDEEAETPPPVPPQAPYEAEQQEPEFEPEPVVYFETHCTTKNSGLTR